MIFWGLARAKESRLGRRDISRGYERRGAKKKKKLWGKSGERGLLFTWVTWGTCDCHRGDPHAVVRIAVAGGGGGSNRPTSPLTPFVPHRKYSLVKKN